MMDNGNGLEYDAPVETVEDVYSPPKPDSPRTVWFRQNREMLDKKEAKEKEKKEALIAAADEYKAAFYAERHQRIEKTKRINREEEAKAQERMERPEGSIWERIIHMIDFNKGVQQKDVSRARTLLFQAKDANLPMQDN